MSRLAFALLLVSAFHAPRPLPLRPSRPPVELVICERAPWLLPGHCFHAA